MAYCLNHIDLDTVLEGITQSPVSLNDLKFYLKDIEHSEENLEFLLWYRRYCLIYQNRPSHLNNSTSDFIQLPEQSHQSPKSIDHPHRASMPPIEKSIIIPDLTSTGQNNNKKPSSILNQRVSSFTIPSHLPFATELKEVIDTFFLPESPMELNLPGELTLKLFKDLQTTTEPKIFIDCYEHIYNILNFNSFPKFMSISKQNLNHLDFLMNIGLIIIFLTGLITTYACLFYFKVNRWWRLFAFPIWFVLIASVLCAIYGVFSMVHILGIFKSDRFRFRLGLDDDRSSKLYRSSILKRYPIRPNQSQEFHKDEEVSIGNFSQPFNVSSMSSAKLLGMSETGSPTDLNPRSEVKLSSKALNYLKLIQNRILIISLLASITCTIPFLLFPF